MKSLKGNTYYLMYQKALNNINKIENSKLENLINNKIVMPIIGEMCANISYHIYDCVIEVPKK
jgi:hypothetical protein